MKYLSFVLASLILALCISNSATAAVSVDLGYVSYGYSTYCYDFDNDGRNDEISLDARLSSIHKVEHASVSIRPYESYWPSEKDSPQFVASASFHGSLDTLSDGTSGNFWESLQHDGRFLSFFESSSLYSRREWQRGDEDIPTGQFRDTTGGSFNLGEGFSVHYSSGDYREYPWTSEDDGVIQEHWNFSYYVTWDLYCSNLAAAQQLYEMGAQEVSISAVPEPSCMAFGGFIGLGLLRRQRKM